MALQPYSEPESTLISTVSHAESAPYSGAFFPRASGFTINGGVFTSNVTKNVSNPPPEEPSGSSFLFLSLIPPILTGGNQHFEPFSSAT
ncbi:hypothetical protein B0H14DRAFT_3486220 [Mycena olivaceomarginata]|nr:hypothetical protein B0H14DRAFT_3486220 [Mycena olivaceomarginata]